MNKQTQKSQTLSNENGLLSAFLMHKKGVLCTLPSLAVLGFFEFA